MHYKIGWIGTGVMGAPMAGHLAAAGHTVTVYNRTRSRAEALAPTCRVASTIREAVADADFVFSIVGFVQDVEEVWLGPDGILAHAKSGARLLDLTTSSPTLAQKIWKRGQELGHSVLDAPVTGGDRGAREATLSIMVGGEAADFDAALPLLEILGSAVTYMGPAGSGQHAKLANQMAIAGAIAGVAEALTYAKSHALNLEDMLRVINNGSAASWQSQNMGVQMLAGDEAPGFYLKHFVKDLRLGQSERGELDLPVSAKVLSLYETLLEEGFGDLGTQALLRYYQGGAHE